MKSRGQLKFPRLSPFGARNYERLMAGPMSGEHYPRFARDLAERVPSGSVLDLGTGPGRMLEELRLAAPGLELHGLDISPAMLERARLRLGEGIDLRLGSAAATGYGPGSFDAVTCTKSFYLWDDPDACLAEIHRVLKPGGRAILYESVRDCDLAAVDAAIRLGLRSAQGRSAGLLLRLLAPAFLRRQLAETYSRQEIRAIAERSPFRTCGIEDAGVKLPVWVRVELRKA